MGIKEKVFNYVKKIPKGKVATYTQVARKTGTGARVVGNILHINKDPQRVPCHRVVRSDGTVAQGYAFGGRNAQIRKLQSEGIAFENRKIDLEKYLVKL